MSSLDLKVPAKGKEGHFHVIIEIPAEESIIKYEYNHEIGGLMVDRFMQSSMRYPCNYGFVPQTLAGDGDPADVLVITPYPLLPGVVILVRPVAVLIMEDEKGMDEKIIAVPEAKIDPSQANIKDLEDLSPLFLDKVKHFFEHYKDLDKGKWVKLKAYENAAKAVSLIEEAIENFEKKH